MHWIHYTLVFTLPAATILGFFSEGWLKLASPIYAFGIIPLVELLIGPQHENTSDELLRTRKGQKIYDFLLLSQVPVVYVVMLIYLNVNSSIEVFSYDWYTNSLGMGLILGAVAINVGHELGHRSKSIHRRAGLMLLLSSAYMHFNIEHNHGHHIRVATPDDPATARKGEWLYQFWVRSVFTGWLSAFKIEQERTKRDGRGILANKVILFGLIQIIFFALIGLIWGTGALLAYIFSAVIGILMLETVNYIEHYGLERKQLANGRYEPVRPWHSWNSDHLIGRMVLFELSRHSDHHHRASRKYQTLRSVDGAPNLPTGYPGMMVLSTFPPLFFAVMRAYQAKLE